MENKPKNNDDKKELRTNVNFNDIKAIIGEFDLFTSKLTSENISKIAEYQHEENMIQKEIDKAKPFYIVVVVSIVISFLIFMIIILKDNANLLKEIFDKVVYLLVGIFGGIGIDRAFFKGK